MKPVIFENTEYGPIEIHRDESGKPTLAYFRMGDAGYSIDAYGFFKDWVKTEFRVNWCKGQMVLFVYSPREIGRTNY